MIEAYWSYFDFANLPEKWLLLNPMYISSGSERSCAIAALPWSWAASHPTLSPTLSSFPSLWTIKTFSIKFTTTKISSWCRLILLYHEIIFSNKNLVTTIMEKLFQIFTPQNQLTELSTTPKWYSLCIGSKFLLHCQPRLLKLHPHWLKVMILYRLYSLWINGHPSGHALPL